MTIARLMTIFIRSSWAYIGILMNYIFITNRFEQKTEYSIHDMPREFAGCCAHDHDCEELDCGGTWTLNKYIDLSQVCCIIVMV